VAWACDLSHSSRCHKMHTVSRKPDFSRPDEKGSALIRYLFFSPLPGQDSGVLGEFLGRHPSKRDFIAPWLHDCDSISTETRHEFDSF
jgi:hypothetical protein